MPVYLVRARVPNATAADIAAAAERAATSAAELHREGFGIRYVDTIYVPADDWLGCMYDADTAAAARLATERAVLPFDDIAEAIRYAAPADLPAPAPRSRLPSRDQGRKMAAHSLSRVVSERTDPRVDDYIAGLPDWQQEICRRVREIVHEADPEVEETIKRSVRPYFVLHGNVCALLATKDHVNVFIYDPIAPDPDGIINQGHGNATARSVQIYHDDVINRKALLSLLRDVIANNRAGGWRKIQTGR